MKVGIPETYKSVRKLVGSVEQVLPMQPDRAWDVVFTMATLTHIPYENSWVMVEIARCTNRYIICVELEKSTKSERHYPRYYKPLYSALGFDEALVVSNFPGLPDGYVGRVFRRQ